MVQEASTRGDARTWIPFFVALVPFLCFAWHFAFLCDDGYINLRYGKNLAQGLGLRFNPSEPVPVEGYTALLWVSFLGLLARLGANLERAAPLVTTAAGAILLFSALRFCARRVRANLWQQCACGLFLATLPPLCVWASGGMEALLLALFVFGVFAGLHADGAQPRTGLALSCAALTVLLRSDGIVWVAFLCAGTLAAARVAEREYARRLVKAACIVGGFALLVLALHILLRRAYHGRLLPNTALAKVEFSASHLQRGINYVVATLLCVPSIVFAAIVSLWRMRRVERSLWLACVLPASAGLAYAALLSGDFMPMGRFLVPALPLLAIAFIAALKSRETDFGVARLGPVALAALAIGLSVASSFDWNPIPRSWRARFHFRWNTDVYLTEIEQWRLMRDRAQEWGRTGRAIALHTERGESMIGSAIGALGYFSDLDLMDLFGLVDPNVGARPTQPRASPGHDKRVEPEYFLSARPTFFSGLVARQGANEADVLGPGFAASVLSRCVAIERYPLRGAEGFHDDEELWLLRLRWDVIDAELAK